MLIFGSNFDARRLVSRALRTFYGVGPDVGARLMAKFHIHPTARVGALADRQLTGLEAEMNGMRLENALRREVQDNIRRLRDMGTYRGRRHAMSLPVRGQRTRSQVSGGSPGVGDAVWAWADGGADQDRQEVEPGGPAWVKALRVLVPMLISVLRSSEHGREYEHGTEFQTVLQWEISNCIRSPLLCVCISH